MNNEFNIGDTVWFARCKSIKKHIPCDACQGQKYLTVFMGDGSQVTIDCAGCQSGYDPPTGYVVFYESVADSVCTKIDRINITADGVEYITTEGYSGKDCMFATKEEADLKAAELGKEYEAERKHRLEHTKENDKRTWAWNASYHRRKIKENQKQVEYHTAKLNVADIKAKEQKRSDEHDPGDAV